jgi:conjugative relaxase-like TrwC/TraI family protein
MLSIGRIGAGDGYRYLTDQVATQDAPRAGEALLGYYERTGYPPGVWLGAQAAAFGLAGRVDEASMGALFGRCADPSDGSQLGRRMAVYRSVDERVADRLGSLGHPAGEEERAAIEAEEAAKGTPQAVTGFDLTFSAPKSVSVLFALGDPATQEAVRAAHAAAWRDGFAYFESQVAATRLGAGGVAQVDVRGVAAAAFEHWYSRAGDPQLHTHVATSVMVQTTDERWRRLDSRALYRASAAAGERYTARLMAELTDQVGVGWRHRRSGRSGTALPEVAGIGDELVKAFSQRSAAIDDGLAALVGDYKARHGYAPDRETLARLAQTATLSDRPAGEHRSLSQSRATWMSEAARVLGCSPGEVTGVVAEAVRARAGRLREVRALRRRKVRRQARRALARLEETGATWTGWELRRAVTVQLREAGFRADGPAVERVVAMALALPELRAVAASGEEPEAPESLRRADGASVFDRRGEDRYTSTRVLGAEAALVALALDRRLPRHERARRAGSGFAEVDDDALVAGAERAEGHVGGLRRRLTAAQEAAAGAGADLAQVEAALAEHRPDGGPALRAARQGIAVQEAAAGRLAAIDEALSRRGLRRPGGQEREALAAERAALVGEHPGATQPPEVRRSRVQAAEATAGRADSVAREGLLIRRGDARGRLDRASGQARVLGAQIDEQAQAIAAMRHELAERQGSAGRVSLEGRLEGLGADQAAAMVRLADPSRPLDALIGPAGSGKTTALSRLTGAFRASGRAVHVLAPTAVAAKALGEAVEAPHATLHAALAGWRKGRGVPGAGDLVLIDEASMATTPLLVETARLAASRGALVRLIGDPRQLKAVGAGGGLALVADAAGSPELSELRRFNHAWEAEATLALRRGDSAALDAYLAHDRIAGSLDAVATQEVFASWWDSPAGREATVMVASHNATVRQLNHLARSARIDAGEVAAEGVALHDGTLAGVGDVVTTRRNERLVATRRNGGPAAHVRNHDRWRVEAVGADGSLTLAHLERPDRARLPESYVARDVELAYADTGHAVQGRTVERAEVLVKPGDTRWYLYVAMSRAREHSVAHVVTDQVEEEPAGYHPVRSAREVLEAVLARDEPVSASEWARAAEAARVDPALVAERYRTGAAEELRARLATAMAAHGGVLAGPEGWRVLAAAQAVEAAGMDAGAVLAEAAGADVAGSDVGALVGALDRARFSGADPAGRARPAPLAAGVLPAPGAQVAPDVAAWQTSLARRLESWRDDLARRLDVGEVPPQWAARLGPAPTDPEERQTWAAKIAQVALYRVVHRVEGDSLLGPDVALGTPASRARVTAQAAAAVAEQLAGSPAPREPARQPLAPNGHRRPPPSAEPSQRPTRS